jgi:hypothetical protein
MNKFNKIEILENGTIQLREVEVLELADGTTMDGAFYRKVLTPGADLTDQDPKVVAIANATWSVDVVTAYNDMLAAQEANLGE